MALLVSSPAAIASPVSRLSFSTPASQADRSTLDVPACWGWIACRTFCAWRRYRLGFVHKQLSIHTYRVLYPRDPQFTSNLPLLVI